MWSVKNNALEMEYIFRDFNEAFGFVCRVALLSEKADHHPDIRIMYNRVCLKLSTHDAGGTITGKDHDLADAISQLFDE
jgi:4a-hydroxytetrahydrobiopterin dehydratase